MKPRGVFTKGAAWSVLLFVFAWLLSGLLTAKAPAPLATAVSPPTSSSLDVETKGDVVRLLTYNIQWGMGVDGVRDLDRVVTHLRRIDADVVLLNEVDVNWRRSGNVDQPTYIQKAAGYPYAFFAPALVTWSSGNLRASRYGNLLLSRFPIVAARNVRLPVGWDREPRSAVVAELDVQGEPWIVAGTHLGLHRGDRKRQTETLLEQVTVEADAARRDRAQAEGRPRTVSVVVMGDFNARPDARELAALRGVDREAEAADANEAEARAERPGTAFAPLRDAFGDLPVDARPTFPYPKPYARIDYVFLSEDLQRRLVDAAVLSCSASDHLPVVVDVALPRDKSAKQRAGALP